MGFKFNKNVTENITFKRYRDMAFNNIIFSAFESALPFNKNDLSSSERRELATYSLNVMNSLGNYSILESAIKENKEPENRVFLKELARICNSIATEATERSMKKAEKDGNFLEENFVDHLTITKEEMEKLSNDKEESGISLVSDLVRDKTVNMLREEKVNHSKMDNTTKEIANILKGDEVSNFEEVDDLKGDVDESTPPQDDSVAVDSYLKVVTKSKDIVEYKSLFTSLHNIAYEQLLSNIYDDSELSATRLTNITLENSLFGEIKEIEKDTEKTINKIIAFENAAEVPEELRSNYAGKALIDATTIYTLLEVLHTLNLLKVSPSDIKTMMNKIRYTSDRILDDRKYVKASVNKMLFNKEKELNAENDLGILMQNKDKLEVLSDKMTNSTLLKETLAEKDFLHLDQILDRYNKKIDAIDNKITGKTMTYAEAKMRDRDLYQFNKIKTLLSRLPGNVTDLVLRPSQSNQSYLDVEYLDKNRVVKNITVVPETPELTVEQVSEFIRECGFPKEVAIEYQQSRFGKSFKIQ